jgi:hypothetical protein
MAEWGSTDSYTTRINKISKGVGPTGMILSFSVLACIGSPFGLLWSPALSFPLGFL